MPDAQLVRPLVYEALARVAGDHDDHHTALQQAPPQRAPRPRRRAHLCLRKQARACSMPQPQEAMSRTVTSPPPPLMLYDIGRCSVHSPAVPERV